MDDGFKEAGMAGITWDGLKSIQGEYVNKKTGVGKHNNTIYTIDVDGDHVDVWSSTVLDTKFAEIPIGAIVRIEPQGIATSKTGSEYKDYRVFYKVSDIAKIFPGAKEIL